MHFDIVEAIRQKQREYVRSISVENGETVDISIDDGNVVVRSGVRRQDEIETLGIERQAK
jgi:hypothetical protein